MKVIDFFPTKNFQKKVGEFTLRAIDGNLGENGKTVQIAWR